MIRAVLNFVNTPTITEGFVEKVYFTLNTSYSHTENERESSTHAFRIHIYENDPVMHKPGKELTERNIIINREPENFRKNKTFVDLSKYNIPLSAGGVFVGFEYMAGYSDDKSVLEYGKLCLSHIKGRGYPTFQRWRLKGIG
jgi:hypothetical protein